MVVMLASSGRTGDLPLASAERGVHQEATEIVALEPLQLKRAPRPSSASRRTASHAATQPARP